MMSLHSLPSCMASAEKYAATNPKWHGTGSSVGPLATAPPDGWYHGEEIL